MSEIGLGTHSPCENATVATSGRFFIPMNSLAMEPKAKDFDRLAEYWAALLAQLIIARIQDESRFYHFWR